MVSPARQRSGLGQGRRYLVSGRGCRAPAATLRALDLRHLPVFCTGCKRFWATSTARNLATGKTCEGEGRETYVGSDDLPAALRPVDSEDLYPRRARAWCRGRRPPYASTPLRTLAGEVPRNGGRGQEYPGPIQGGPELYRSVLDRRWKTGATPAPAEVGKSKVGGIDLNQRRMRWVVEAVIAWSPSPRGFTASQMASRVRALCQPTHRHMAPAAPFTS